MIDNRRLISNSEKALVFNLDLLVITSFTQETTDLLSHFIVMSVIRAQIKPFQDRLQLSDISMP